jgi:hypothetical protein
MSFQIFGRILALPEGMSLRRTEEANTVSLGLFVVVVHVIDVRTN